MMVALFILTLAANLSFIWLYAGGYDYIRKWGEGQKNKEKGK